MKKTLTQPSHPSQHCFVHHTQPVWPRNRSSISAAYLNSILPLGEVSQALLSLLKNPGGVLLRQPATQSAGQLGPEIERQVLLVLVEQAELSALLGVDDGQDTGDRLPEVVAIASKESLSAKSVPNPCLHFPLQNHLWCSSFRGEHRIDVHLVELGARGGDFLDA